MRAFTGRVLAPLMMLGLSAGAAAAQIPAPPAVNLTTFAGAAMAPDAQAVSGIGVGVRPQPGPVSIEFEYARSRSEPRRVPSIMTFAGNFLFQAPVRRSRFELYGTFGVGFYALQSDHQSSGADSATNFGGGAKVTLAGPLKLRIDYRVFRLAGSGEHRSNQHRVSLGIAAGF